ncbi:MAG: SMP-30/gluconolactonase/LRE family protein [Candidatus Handelsmanbacteria bacterium]|nr:SMP-30/gluconolactonase/LRE family protein [Candidatus Handelsmanbacteria bacterium]
MLSPELFIQGLSMPGGLAFDADEQLFVAETHEGRIRKIGPHGKPIPFAATGGKPLGIAFDDSNDLFVAEKGRRHLLLISADEAVEVYAHQCKGKRFNGPQDLCFGPSGDLIFTDAGEQASGSIYSVDIDAEATLLAAGLANPTGLVLSQDASSLFVIEAGLNRILTLPFAKGGILSAPQVFIQFDEGQPPKDLLFDDKGRLYITRPGAGLTIADPDGQFTAQIPIPGDEPTALVFGGPNFDELYIAEASGGSIYRLRTESPGQRPFAGPRSI